ncbi:hypothetical protein AB9F42_36210, partial [Rhizobium leguminosarum]
ALKEKAVDRVLTVIAHELTAHTRAALIDNTIDAILNQDAGIPERVGNEPVGDLRVVPAFENRQDRKIGKFLGHESG